MGTKCKGCGSCLLFIITTVLVYRLSLPVFLESFDPEGPALPSDSRDLPKADRTYGGGRHLVCHTFNGGLGSLLFQYASAAGIASRQGRIVVATSGRREDSEEQEEEPLEDWEEEDDRKWQGRAVLERALKTTIFKSDLTQCRSVVRLTETACCRFDQRLTKLDRTKNYEIDGKLQSYKYFHEDLEAVREFVALKESVIARAKRKIWRSLKHSNISSLSNVAAVGVHVRRGDKLHWSAVDAGVRVAPREFFLKAMRHFRKTLPEPVVFLVVSDDPAWCRSNFQGLPGVVLVTNQRRRDWAKKAGVGGKAVQDVGGDPSRKTERRSTGVESKDEKVLHGKASDGKEAEKDASRNDAGRVKREAQNVNNKGGIYLDGGHHHHNTMRYNNHRHGGGAGEDEEEEEEGDIDEAAVDLAVLSLVDHSIISVGAFSWWAGFLARGTVIYYGQFVDADSKLRAEYDDKMADYVLPGWIKMS